MTTRCARRNGSLVLVRAAPPAVAPKPRTQRAVRLALLPSYLFQSLKHCKVPLTCWQMSTPRSASCCKAFLAAVTSWRRRRVRCRGGKREAASSGVKIENPEACSDSSRVIAASYQATRLVGPEDLGTSRTGQGALRKTCAVVLPIRNLRNHYQSAAPPYPRTMQATCRTVATFTTSSPA